ncbi:LCP family protein [Kytococcus sedentarius]|nr:LCP family protein [Kytococcus sedentarius]QQB64293.1 LCP family protein [Kytococcus sedentarius]
MVVLLAVWLIATGAAVFDSWRSVERTDAMPTWEGRPADTAGRNYLLVGSDGRDSLTPEQRKRLGTGAMEGQRTDTIMLVHVPTFGTPTLVSIPRDSYVPIRGMGENKINASYNVGGAPLLIDTVEQNTGLRIDGYTEIGFGGFADVVDSLGGVEICAKTDIVDEKAHLDIKAGCQTMDGVTALGFVRARYFDPRGDLGRVERQRQFLNAISKQVVSPSTLLLPWELHDVGTAVAPALTVDEHDSGLEIAMALNAVRRASGGDNQVTVPVSDSTLRTEHGWAVQWDSERSEALWKALREGDDIPSDL